MDTRDRPAPQITYVPQENLEVMKHTAILHPSTEVTSYMITCLKLFCNRTILRTSMGHNTYRGPGWEQFIQETKHKFVDWTGNTRAQETHSNEKFSYLGFWICGFIFFPAGLS